jgi:hypothetical protein
MVIQLAPGSAVDFAIDNPGAGTTIMSVPTGTPNVVFGGTMSFGNGANGDQTLMQGLGYVMVGGVDGIGAYFKQNSNIRNFQIRDDAGAAAVSVQGVGAGANKVQFPNVGTTASASNTFLDNTDSNKILRSTSSRRYKRDIRTLSLSDARRIVMAKTTRPVTYRSRTSADDQRRKFLGLISEESAKTDNALVHFDGNGRPDGVMYDRYVVPMLAVLKNHETQLKRLRSRS